MLSTATPAHFWNASTEDRVFGPKVPSTAGHDR
jgi:hypothetical protein